MKDEEERVFECTNCHAVYHEQREIMRYEDEIHVAAEEEQPELSGVSTAGSGLMPADDETDPSLIDQLYKSARHKPNEGEGAESWD